MLFYLGLGAWVNGGAGEDSPQTAQIDADQEKQPITNRTNDEELTSTMRIGNNEAAEECNSFSLPPKSPGAHLMLKRGKSRMNFVDLGK